MPNVLMGCRMSFKLHQKRNPLNTRVTQQRVVAKQMAAQRCCLYFIKQRSSDTHLSTGSMHTNDCNVEPHLLLSQKLQRGLVVSGAIHSSQVMVKLIRICVGDLRRWSKSKMKIICLNCRHTFTLLSNNVSLCTVEARLIKSNCRTKAQSILSLFYRRADFCSVRRC